MEACRKFCRPSEVASERPRRRREPCTVYREPQCLYAPSVHRPPSTDRGLLLMIGMASSLEQLRQRLALLPGVGPKMAERLAFYLLRAPAKEVQDLIRTLEEARQNVVYCPI